MNSKRLHSALLASIGLLFVLMIAGAYGANKLLVGQSDKLTVLKARSQALDQEQITLNRAKKDIKTYSDLNKIAEAVVPQDKDQAEAVREIVNIASKNGVTLASITFPASTLGNLPNGTAPSASGTSGSAGSGTASGSSAAASGNSKANNLSQLTPVPSIPGVYQLPITIKGDSNNPVQYERFISFLSDLEHNRRTAQVESIELQPDATNPDLVDFSLTLNEYIKP